MFRVYRCYYVSNITPEKLNQLFNDFIHDDKDMSLDDSIELFKFLRTLSAMETQNVNDDEMSDEATQERTSVIEEK